jgi:penicillin-binding protein 1B
MEEVLRSGTAAAVRAQGFSAPAAGKTGTSHDGWFAGYTSQLLCVVWVGFDDNRELDLEGAHSAAPIWGEFMKRAIQFREYRSAQPFDAPDGVITVDIDPQSGMLATPSCPTMRQEVYIAGTQPVQACPLHSNGRPMVTSVSGWQTNPAQPTAPAPDGTVRLPAPGDPAATVARRAPPRQDSPQAAQQPQQNQKEEKKGFFRRLWGVFK